MLVDPIEFVDERKIEWQRVKRLRYFCYQRFLYTYPGPVRNLHQKLRVLPPERYGDQTLCDFDLAMSPHPATHSESTDRFGNHVFQLEVAWIRRSISFEARMLVERLSEPYALPEVTTAEAQPFLQFTELTTADERITAVAEQLQAESGDELELAERINEWVAAAMSYGSGATGVHTTAAQALATGKGLCQDYAHIMLSICRVVGLPARYVSGHMLAEGGSHAWVDVFVPSQRPGYLEPIGFDPTNRRRPNLGYTTVATGRDYRDVAPTSGVYTGSYTGQLASSKRAGLTLLEFVDGDILTASYESRLFPR